MLRTHGFSVVADFNVVFDGIEELNRESFGGVEDDLEIVGLIAIAAFNSEASLLSNRVR
jgi:hypothetical protein